MKLTGKHIKVEYNGITMKPEELYNELQVYRPDWLQKIPQS